MLEELQIPPAEDDADALLPTLKPAPVAAPGQNVDFSALAGFTFTKAAGMTEDEAIQLATEAADQVIESP